MCPLLRVDTKNHGGRFDWPAGDDDDGDDVGDDDTNSGDDDVDDGVGDDDQDDGSATDTTTERGYVRSPPRGGTP